MHIRIYMQASERISSHLHQRCRVLLHVYTHFQFCYLDSIA